VSETTSSHHQGGTAVSDATPRIFRLLLEVSDLDGGVDFYSRLLGTSGRAVRGGRHYFDCGEVILGLVDVSPTGRAPRPTPEHVYFAVSDLGDLHARAAQLGCLSDEDVHGSPAGEPVVRPWGERSFYAVDPFGNRLCFVDDETLFTAR
jgi:predicted enzyme related to lactoylglutathione lyase